MSRRRIQLTGTSGLDGVRLYTRNQVRIYLRPLAVLVLLVIAAGPAAAMTCEVACSSTASQGHEHNHGGDHGDMATAEHSPFVPWQLRSDAPACDHDGLTAPAIASSLLKVFAPVADGVFAVGGCQELTSTRFAVNQRATASPPGIRSGPPPLRI